jgi:hypothetical protein
VKLFAVAGPRNQLSASLAPKRIEELLLIGPRPMKLPTETLDRETCRERWAKQFGFAPPKHTSVEFMLKVFAYEAQVGAFGGHSRAIRQVLKECLKEPRNLKASGDTKTMPSPVVLRPGMYLVREWNGHVYRVEVTSAGFQMNGREYSSLTAIAREITGSGWSGPRFFGLART